MNRDQPFDNRSDKTPVEKTPVDEMIDEADFDSEILYDRLVDGELGDEAYRRLISKFDEQPDRWRKCALAFLEAQAWRSDFAALEETPVENNQPSLNNESHKRRPNWWGLFSAMAASFTLALGLGLWLRGQWDGSPPAPQMVDKNDEGEANSQPESETQPANNAPQPERAEDAPPVPLSPRGEVRLVAEGAQGEPSHHWRLPVYDLEGLVADWLSAQPAPPRSLMEAMRRSGHDLRQRQEWLLIELEDGRRVLAPLEQWEIEPRRSERRFQ